MKIFVDGRPLVAAATGIATFLRCSLYAWASSSPDDTFYVGLPQALHKTISLDSYPSNVVLVQSRHAVYSKLPNLAWLNTEALAVIRRLHADVFFSALPAIPYGLPKRVKTVIVVHDVVNIEFKDTMQLTNRLSNLLFFNRSVRGADLLWTNSQYTRSKVEHYFPSRRCQNIVVGDSCNRMLYRSLNLTDDIRRSICNKYGIKNRFILFVGSLEPRKNLSFLLTIAPEIYHRTGATLVVVGAKGWKNSDVRAIVESDSFPRESVIFCNYVPDEDLVALYNMATCFVSASLNEGFGSPQLEALCCGCPIVTSRNSAMQEVAEGKTGARTVAGYKPEDWVEAVVGMIEHPEKPVETQLSDFDWNKIVARVKARVNKLLD